MIKRLLLSAAFTTTLAVSVQSASAAQVCPRGKMVNSCINHISNMESIGKRLSACFTDLADEYHGLKGGGAGKGGNYDKKRAQCYQLAQDALADITDAYVPGGDTSPRRALRQAVKNWTPVE